MSINSSKISIFKDILGPFYKTSEEHLFYCPFCKHKKKKLSINFKKGVFKCWVCEKTGGLKYLVSRFGSPQQKNAWSELTGMSDMSEKSDLLDLLRGKKKEIIAENITLPDEFRSLVTKRKDILAVPALKYLFGRGISRKDIFKWRIGYSLRGDYAGKVIIPSFGIDGSINYFVGRAFGDDWPKYKNPRRPANEFIFNELNIDFRRPIILTEGVFDAIIAGENAIPLLGSSVSKKSRLFFEIVKNNPIVYVALDPDAQKKEERLISTLLEYDLSVYKIVVHGFADVAEMGKKEFQLRKKEATRIDRQILLTWKLARGVM